MSAVRIQNKSTAVNEKTVQQLLGDSNQRSTDLISDDNTTDDFSKNETEYDDDVWDWGDFFDSFWDDFFGNASYEWGDIGDFMDDYWNGTDENSTDTIGDDSSLFRYLDSNKGFIFAISFFQYVSADPWSGLRRCPCGIRARSARIYCNRAHGDHAQQLEVRSCCCQSAFDLPVHSSHAGTSPPMIG